MAKLSGAGTVIAIDCTAERLEPAWYFGADVTLDLSKLPREQHKCAILAASSGRGADGVIEYTGHKDAFGEGLRLGAQWNSLADRLMGEPGRTTV